MNSNLSRRDFLRKSAAVGAAAGLATTMPSLLEAGAARAAGSSFRPSVTRTAAPNPDMNVTLTVYSVAGWLYDFTGANPKNPLSMYNLYNKIWRAKWPNLKFKEVDTTPSQILTKMTLAVNSGNPPDIVVLGSLGTGLLTLRNQIMPLDSYFQQYGITDSLFIPGMAEASHYGGHWWSMPLVSNPIAGQRVVIPKYIAPFGYSAKNLVTFDDWYNLSNKMVQFDSAGHLTRIGMELPVGWLYGGIQYTDAWCLPGHGLYNAANQPTPTDPGVVAALTWQKKLMNLYGGPAKYNAFVAGDPDLFSESPKAYIATGKAVATGNDNAYWAVSGLDASTFGVKGGLQYDMTVMPPVVDASKAAAYVSNLNASAQVAVIPRGAKHPDAAFALLKLIAWDYGYLLGPSTNGDVVAADQKKWVQGLIAGEAATRKANGLPGNPVANLEGIKKMPDLVRTMTGHMSTNPVDTYYQTQFNLEQSDVFYGRKTPEAAMQDLQKKVNAEKARLKGQYGSWNW